MSEPQICPTCKLVIPIGKIGYRGENLLGFIDPKHFCSYLCFREYKSSIQKKRTPKYKDKNV